MSAEIVDEAYAGVYCGLDQRGCQQYPEFVSKWSPTAIVEVIKDRDREIARTLTSTADQAVA